MASNICTYKLYYNKIKNNKKKMANGKDAKRKILNFQRNRDFENILKLLLLIFFLSFLFCWAKLRNFLQPILFFFFLSLFFNFHFPEEK